MGRLSAGIRKWAAVCGALLALAGGGVLAAPQSEAELEALIQTAIENRHPPENESEWWRALGPAAPRVIIRMYRATSRSYYRLRLLQALAWFDDAEAVEFLKNEARTTDNPLIRGAAIKTVGHSQGEKEMEFLQEFLAHPDEQTRLAAASAVQRIGSPRADAVLQEYRKGEKAGWIVSKLDKQKEQKERARLAVQPGPGTVEPLLKELPGSWKGQWLEPDGQAEGLKPLEAALVVSSEGGALKGSLSRGKGKELREFTLESVQVKGASVSGTLVAAAPKSAAGKPVPAPGKYSFAGEWKRREGHSLLALEVPRLAVTAVFRKK